VRQHDTVVTLRCNSHSRTAIDARIPRPHAPLCSSQTLRLRARPAPGEQDESIERLFLKLDLNMDGQIDIGEWVEGFGFYQEAIHKVTYERLSHEILEALAAVRADPAGCAERIKQRLDCYAGKNYTPKATKAGQSPPLKVTKEGAAAVHDALEYLLTQEPLPGFSTVQVQGLVLSAGDHCADIGQVGVASHTGSDGSACGERQQRYGQWTGACGECLWYGRAEPWVTGQSVVDDLIVDDGVPDRGHRLAVFDTRYNMAGVAVGMHNTFGQMAAIEFANAYTDEDDAIAARVKNGPPKIENTHNRKGEKRTQWQLGHCMGCNKKIEGGKVIEAAGGKWHAQCFCCMDCHKPLAGVKEKKEEEGKILCKPCWVKAYAPTCYICNKKIEGDRVKKGDMYRHPTCKAAKAPPKKTTMGGPMGGMMGGKPKPPAKGKPAKKPGFGSAKNSLDSMAMGYGDLM